MDWKESDPEGETGRERESERESEKQDSCPIVIGGQFEAPFAAAAPRCPNNRARSLVARGGR